MSHAIGEIEPIGTYTLNGNFGSEVRVILKVTLDLKRIGLCVTVFTFMNARQMK